MTDKIRQLFQKMFPQEKKDYIYFHLVENDTDVVGMIAYCKYKASKIEHILSFIKANERRPTDSELLQFQTHQINPTTIAAYRESALKTFEIINATMLEKRSREYDLKEKALKKKEKLIDDISNKCPAQKHGGGFWMSVLASIVSTILLSIIFIALWISNLLPSAFAFLKDHIQN